MIILPRTYATVPLKNTFDLPGVLYDDIDVTVPLNGSYDTKHDLYFFPNPVSEDVFSSEWSLRHTRTNFVVSVGGQEYNYPVTLPVGVRNTAYTFNEVIITRIGTLDPESPLSFVSLEFADPSVGDMGTVDGGVVDMKPRACYILFGEDGVDPFEYFADYIEVNSGLPVIFFSDGEVGPFNAVTDRLTVGSIRGIIVFKDGTVLPFDEFPEDIDLPNVEKVIIFNGSVEEFLKQYLDLEIDYARGVLIFKDGTIMPFDEVPEGLDITAIRQVIIFDDTLVDEFNTLYGDLVITVGSAGVIVFRDGTVGSFEDAERGLELGGISSLITLGESSLADFFSETVDVVFSVSGALVVVSEGGLESFENSLTEFLVKSGLNPVVFGTAHSLEGFIDSGDESLEMISGNFFAISFSSSGMVLTGWDDVTEDVIVK